MFTICCTSKLLKRTGLPVEPLIPGPTTALGDWYANILFFHHKQILLFVSDRSRLAVITPAKETRALEKHLAQHLADLLNHLGAQPEWIDAEIREMADARFAATHNRSVLGTMNDYVVQMRAIIYESEEVSPLDMAIYLTTCPVGPLQYQCPGEVTIEMLKRSYNAG